MALARLLAGTPESDALIHGDILPDLGGLTDDHPGSVVDEEAFAQSGPRVDLDTGQQTADLRHEARGQRHLALPESLRRPVEPQSMQPRVAGEDLDVASRGRVPLS